MKSKRLIIIGLIVSILFIFSGCGTEKNAETTEQNFLTNAFTTNYEGRWDNYKDALGSTENDPVKIYYSNLEPLCTEDGLDSMSANRIPFEYEELAEKYGYTFKPENISVEKTDFTLDLNILSGEDVVGSVKQTGQIQIVSENGKEFVDSIWISNFDELVSYLENVLDSLAKVSDYSKIVADTYQSVNDYYTESLSVDGLSDSQKKEYLSRDDIYAVGKNIAISKAEVQQYTDFYLNNGESKENAQKLAEKDAMERNALYVAAIQNGYEVTEEDINDWLTKLRTMLENDTTGVYQSAMKGFDSEDAYWEYEYEVYRVDLPIQNYVSSLQINTNVSADSENGNSDTDAFSELKQRLADEQDFELTNL
ncbi:MAG: hypothetical protein MR023_00720 [Blautia sp.]|nr:hypothetical protein [Blautia sp.]